MADEVLGNEGETATPVESSWMETKPQGSGALSRMVLGDVDMTTPNAKLYVKNGVKLLHSNQAQPIIQSKLKGSKDQEGIADITLWLIDSLDGSMNANIKNKVDDSVKLKAAEIFTNMIADIGNATGLTNAKEEDINKAGGLAVGKYINKGLANGTITEDDMREAYKVIKAKGLDKNFSFDPTKTPGLGQTATKIPVSSPKPAIPQTNQAAPQGGVLNQGA